MYSKGKSDRKSFTAGSQAYNMSVSCAKQGANLVQDCDGPHNDPIQLTLVLLDLVLTESEER